MVHWGEERSAFPKTKADVGIFTSFISQLYKGTTLKLGNNGDLSDGSKDRPNILFVYTTGRLDLF